MDDDTPTPRCANPACGDPFLPEQDGQKYCSTRCREAAKKRRQRFRLRRGTGGGELLDPQGTSVTRDDPRQYSDFGDVPGDFELAAEIDDDLDDEQAARFHEMVQADVAQRKPRWSWFDLKQQYNQNPGIELASITSERTDRHKAGQAAVQRRLRTSTGQRQDRHNAVTRDVVAIRATESRRLNHHYATADPRPIGQRQEFSFEAESFGGGPYGQGRAAGQRPGHADHSWRTASASKAHVPNPVG